MSDITIIPRAGWGARQPSSSVPLIHVPTPELWLHHTGGSERGPKGMRAIQNYHMDKKHWRDIAYSFVIDDADGRIYEGRGFGREGAHTEDHNSISHAICVMGNFEVDHPQDHTLQATADLIRYGREHGQWNELTGGHRDTGDSQTACPGKYLEVHIPLIIALSEGDEMISQAQMNTLGQWMKDQRKIAEDNIVERLTDKDGVLMHAIFKSRNEDREAHEEDLI